MAGTQGRRTEFNNMLEKKAVTNVAIEEILARRWSTRAFDASRPVTREQQLALLEAARWAPSCHGDEPWRYLIWEKSADPVGWKQAYDCLSEQNRKWVPNAPLLLLSCAGSVFRHNGKPNRWAQHDVGLASMSLCMQAAAFGLATHQMGGFDAEQARAAFAIPPDYTPMAMIAVGYQADASILPDDLRAKELTPRKRKPLQECFYSTTWGKPYPG
jgi:nitroreductase